VLKVLLNSKQTNKQKCCFSRRKGIWPECWYAVADLSGNIAHLSVTTTVSIMSCCSETKNWFDFLVLAYIGYPGILAIKRVYSSHRFSLKCCVFCVICRKLAVMTGTALSVIVVAPWLSVPGVGECIIHSASVIQQRVLEMQSSRVLFVRFVTPND